MIKDDDSEVITLAIGDGANDVSMILEADIGVGLFGKEGLRAVDSSDFAIAEFRFLWHLLFKHGRWNYTKIATMTNYFFYKNFIYSVIQMFFTTINGWSSTSIYPELFLTGYNLLFTAYSLVPYVCFNKDVYPVKEWDGEHIRKFIPNIYYPGQLSQQFNQPLVSFWIVVGLF
jgi:magnesium-transporting ATPase (P-type)